MTFSLVFSQWKLYFSLFLVMQFYLPSQYSISTYIDETNIFFSQTHFKQGYLIILLLPYRLKNTSKDTLIWIYNIYFTNQTY